MKIKHIFVIGWEEPKREDLEAGLFRAYNNQGRAQIDLDALNAIRPADRCFKLYEVDYFEEKKGIIKR